MSCRPIEFWRLFPSIICDPFALMFADNVSSFSDTVARLQKLIHVDITDKLSQKIGMKTNIY